MKPFIGLWNLTHANFEGANILEDEDDFIVMASTMYIDKHQKIVFEINGPNYVQGDVEFKNANGVTIMQIYNSDDNRFNGDFLITSNKIDNGTNVIQEIILTSSKLKIMGQRTLGK